MTRQSITASRTAASELSVYAEGLCVASVCTSLSNDDAEKRMPPTGIRTSWTVSKADFRDGTPNGSPCPQHPNSHRHLLMECWMDTLTLTAQQATLLATGFFLSGVGAAYLCHAIIAALLTARLAVPEPEVIVVEAPRRRPPALPARQRFTTNVGSPAASANKPAPALVVSPVQWSRLSFDDPWSVRLAVQIGANT